MATAPTAAAAELPTLSQQVVTAVDQALYDRVMGSLKVSHTATEPPPELLPAELDDVLRLTQQMLHRKALMEKLKSTHTGRTLLPACALGGSVTEGLHGLKYERPTPTGNALNLMSLTALHASRSGLLVAPMELEVLFPGLSLPHLSYTETEVECLKSLQVEYLTATEGSGMSWLTCRLISTWSWHCPRLKHFALCHAEPFSCF